MVSVFEPCFVQKVNRRMPDAYYTILITLDKDKPNRTSVRIICRTLFSDQLLECSSLSATNRRGTVKFPLTLADELKPTGQVAATAR